MNKKIAICSCVILLIVCSVVIILFLVRGDKTPLIEEPVATEEPIISTQEPIKEEVSDSTEQYEQDRELKFDNYVTTTKGADSYVTNPNDAKNNGNTNVDVVDSYDFSNGFVLQDTANITVNSYGFDEGKLYGATTNTVIYVKEEDALSTTVQQLRIDTLQMLAMNYYLACEPMSIPRDVDLSIGNGITDYQKYFEKSSDTDPTVEDWCQLLCDTVTDTAFGSTLYVEVYLPASEKYTAYAFILCERDRILSISISDTTRDNLWSYLIELTNDSISLVK